MSVVSGILMAIGILFLTAGAVMLLGRRRVAANMSQAGIVKGSRMSATTYSVLISVMQLLIGAGLLILTPLTSFRSREDNFLCALTALSEILGAGGIVLSIALIITGSAGMLFGLRFIWQAWKDRSSWQHDSSGLLTMPTRDRVRMGGGTVLATYGAIAVVFGILLLATYAAGA